MFLNIYHVKNWFCKRLKATFLQKYIVQFFHQIWVHNLLLEDFSKNSSRFSWYFKTTHLNFSIKGSTESSRVAEGYWKENYSILLLSSGSSSSPNCKKRYFETSRYSNSWFLKTIGLIFPSRLQSSVFYWWGNTRLSIFFSDGIQLLGKCQKALNIDISQQLNSHFFNTTCRGFNQQLSTGGGLFKKSWTLGERIEGESSRDTNTTKLNRIFFLSPFDSKSLVEHSKLSVVWLIFLNAAEELLQKSKLSLKNVWLRSDNFLVVLFAWESS